MIRLSDYQVNGQVDNKPLFGGGSQQDIQDLVKSLSAGQTTGRETANLTTASGSPLKVESLERTLKVLTHTEKHATMWFNVPKSAAFNTVEEYNQLTSYGQDRGGFIQEGQLPQEEDSVYVRRSQLIKYLGVVKGVTHPMTLVNTMVGNIIDREAKNGTLWLLRKLDRALFTGDSTMIGEEFNGFVTQHAQNDAFVSLDAYMNSEVIVDARGASLTELMIENAAEGIIENFGIGTSLYAPPKVMSDFVTNFYGNKFIQPNTAALDEGRMGQRVKSFESQFGNIDLNWDIFFQAPPTKKNTTGATSTLAPAAPTADGVNPNTVVAPTDASSKWAAGDAGTYFFAVSAVNQYGESAITVLGAAAAVAAGGAIDLKYTATAGANATESYVIYRSNKGAASAAAATFYPVFNVSLAQLAAGYDGAAALSVRDRDRFMPNTNQAMLVQNDTETLEFKQLAPLMKMDLAITSPAYKFMILLYGTPFLYAPRRMVRIINIGKL